jgi:hypothetical protein
VKVEPSPLGVDVLVEPMGVPPVQEARARVSWHTVQLTVPVGAPPIELPTTVAVSPHVLPTAVSAGGTIVVVKPGAAAPTLKHSALETVPPMLSLEPW